MKEFNNLQIKQKNIDLKLLHRNNCVHSRTTRKTHDRKFFGHIKTKQSIRLTIHMIYNRNYNCFKF